MATLLRTPGTAWSRKDLLDHAWPASGRPALARTVDVYVARLRAKLGRPGDPGWIRTLGSGLYSWNPES